MRISDDRYNRDRLRLDVAMHFIRYEARTHTIRQWTGLTDDRIRKLYRSYLAEGGTQIARHRGKSPQRPAFFLRTARLRQESAALAGLCALLGLLDGRGASSARAAAGIGQAAILCQAYEAYCALVSEPAISFEHAVLLVTALTRRGDLTLEHCSGCGALLVSDPLSLLPARCALCAPEQLPSEAEPPEPTAC